MTVSVLIDE